MRENASPETHLSRQGSGSPPRPKIDPSAANRATARLAAKEHTTSASATPARAIAGGTISRPIAWPMRTVRAETMTRHRTIVLYATKTCAPRASSPPRAGLFEELSPKGCTGSCGWARNGPSSRDRPGASTVRSTNTGRVGSTLGVPFLWNEGELMPPPRAAHSGGSRRALRAATLRAPRPIRTQSPPPPHSRPNR